MPEPYAVRWTGGSWGVGKRLVYRTKADYIAGRAQASDAARKRTERAYEPIKKLGGKKSTTDSNRFKNRKKGGSQK